MTHTQTDEGELKRKKKFEFWDDDRKKFVSSKFCRFVLSAGFCTFLARIDFLFFFLNVYLHRNYLGGGGGDDGHECRRSRWVQKITSFRDR